MEWGEVKKGIRRFNYVVCAIGIAMIIPLMLLTFADVMLRGFFNKPIPGTFEISQYILAVFILLGAAYTQQVKGHVGVDFITLTAFAAPSGGLQDRHHPSQLVDHCRRVWQGWVVGIEEKAGSDQLRIPHGIDPSGPSNAAAAASALELLRTRLAKIVKQADIKVE